MVLYQCVWVGWLVAYPNNGSKFLVMVCWLEWHCGMLQAFSAPYYIM